MLGYRDPRHEWLGKASARLDDLLNLIPARLTALLIILTTWRSDGRRAGAWRIWRRDAHRTESPNAGHPMSAMAGALGVRLEKEAHYVLGAELPPPQLAHLGQARGSLLGIVVMGSILTFLVVTFRPFKRSKQ
jgi:adenosylcobinamide-phosphate synthase